jgi:hypothetical protein
MKKSAKALLGAAGLFFGSGLAMNTFVLTRASKKVSDIKKELEAKTRNTMEEEYLAMLNDLNKIYTTHEEKFNNKQFKAEDLSKDVEEFFSDFNVFLSAYAGIAPVGAAPTK